MWRVHGGTAAIATALCLVPPRYGENVNVVKIYGETPRQSRVAPPARKKVAPTAQGAPAVKWLSVVG